VLFTFDHDFGNVAKINIKSSCGIVIVYIEKMSKEMIFKKSLEFFNGVNEKELKGRLCLAKI